MPLKMFAKLVSVFFLVGVFQSKPVAEKRQRRYERRNMRRLREKSNEILNNKKILKILIKKEQVPCEDIISVSNSSQNQCMITKQKSQVISDKNPCTLQDVCCSLQPMHTEESHKINVSNTENVISVDILRNAVYLENNATAELFLFKGYHPIDNKKILMMKNIVLDYIKTINELNSNFSNLSVTSEAYINTFTDNFKKIFLIGYFIVIKQLNFEIQSGHRPLFLKNLFDNLNKRHKDLSDSLTNLKSDIINSIKGHQQNLSMTLPLNVETDEYSFKAKIGDFDFQNNTLINTKIDPNSLNSIEILESGKQNTAILSVFKDKISNYFQNICFSLGFLHNAIITCDNQKIHYFQTEHIKDYTSFLFECLKFYIWQLSFQIINFKEKDFIIDIMNNLQNVNSMYGQWRLIGIF
ncbi:hypothetical protein EDEG_01265 [Edhazardia aedis USNM 41457]|uniref:Uncharacterized protein n=1 Tax=Edhazardia aedis (strain USNM 41457) TaxID=1003232 RepID=J9DAI8_EDHAE|nr:hypothetical protein EDEG_01265 [Edhazardia aedis USNM 41457]|eukprot:EJW04524.1 hypothetical protein EDEG_01265 [Edhazardia aedis USNM 41457]